MPGEWYSPTFFPVKPPPLTHGRVSNARKSQVTPEQQKYCEDLYDAAGRLLRRSVYAHGYDIYRDISGQQRRRELGRRQPLDPALGYFFVNTRNEAPLAG